MKRYYSGNGWSDDYDDAYAMPLEEAAAVLLNSRLCVDENSTISVLSPDAGSNKWIILRLIDPDLE